ncbi:hypothetical protein FQZ97_1260700 [compost metagenome]
MQGRKHHVTRLCSLDGDVRRFQVPDLANHDYIGILTQEGLGRCSKRQASFFVDVDLVDAWQVDFRGIFRRGNVDARLVQDVQAGVERHGLARAGRTCDQDHAVRATDGIHQTLFFFRFVT